MHGLETLAMQYISASNINKETGINSDVVSENKELAEELHKSVIKKNEKGKVHSPFIDNIWGADLANMQLS